MNNWRKITVIGGCGTGKTTLTNNLSKILNLPVYHIDGFNYEKDWVEVKKEIRDAKIREIIEKDNWILDGTYTSTIVERIEKSDLVIYLDYSTLAQVKGIFQRYFSIHGKEKDDIPGCKERMTWRFLKFTLKWRKNKREFLLSKIKEAENQNKIMIFKNRKQLNKWFENEFGRKIEI